MTNFVVLELQNEFLGLQLHLWTEERPDANHFHQRDSVDFQLEHCEITGPTFSFTKRIEQ